MSKYKQDLSPPSTSAFTHAIHPFHLCIKQPPNDISHHHVHSSPSPNVPAPALALALARASPTPAHLPPALPAPRPLALTGLSKPTQAALASLRTSHVHALLMRCQMLDATIGSFDFVRSGRTQKGWQRRWTCVEELHSVALEARRLAGESCDDPLGREAWSWMEKGEEWGNVIYEGVGGVGGMMGMGIVGDGEQYETYDFALSDGEEGAGSGVHFVAESCAEWRSESPGSSLGSSYGSSAGSSPPSSPRTHYSSWRCHGRELSE
ncbi:hypothetical protein B5807_11191 [Epicoccum nigrum]|uniref:Uncharacterized protein n=1 Tax=Epicoccum nigrum TaxID=105696 RepID=A0A1Y2LKU6_EPING|nr:hypothetical protein B5807_11191 [Epicoccum nigrum]